MPTYQITSSAGVDMGTFEAADGRIYAAARAQS